MRGAEDGGRERSGASRRLFTALELPPPARERVERSLARAAGAALPAARWVKPWGLHCTLRFLGLQSEETAERLPGLMRPTVAGHATMELSLEALGAFPPRGKARVLWLGMGAPRQLAELQSDLERLFCREIGVDPEGREFHPHITVARCKPPWPRRAVESCSEHFRSVEGDRFRVEHVTLFESELHPDGARYRSLAELSLCAVEDEPRRGA